MKPRKLITILLVIALIGFGIWQLTKNLTFSGKSEVTVNGDTQVTYTADIFYNELKVEIDQYYTIVNERQLNSAKASDLDSLSQRALVELDEIEKLLNKVDEVKGNGVPELKTALSKWVTANRSLLTTTLPELAKIMGEDGAVQTPEEADKANELIKSWETKGGQLADQLNDSLDTFFVANEFQVK